MATSQLTGYIAHWESRLVEKAANFSAKPYFHLRLALLASFLVFISGGDALLRIGVGYETIAKSDIWQFLHESFAFLCSLKLFVRLLC
jgi:hypothetical protein